MKPIKTAKLGGLKGDFDFIYGTRYENLEKAKKHLKYEASTGQQFLVKKPEGGVDLYLWQGRDREPVLVAPIDNGGPTEGGNFNPEGANEVGRNFSIFCNTDTEWRIENGDLEPLMSYGETINTLRFCAKYFAITVGYSSLIFNKEPYATYQTHSYVDNEGLQLINEYDNILTEYSIQGIGWEAMGTMNYLKPPREGSGGFATTSVNDVFADERGNIQLTPSTLISILEEATESEKTQIKSLLGIS